MSVLQIPSREGKVVEIRVGAAAVGAHAGTLRPLAGRTGRRDRVPPAERLPAPPPHPCPTEGRAPRTPLSYGTGRYTSGVEDSICREDTDGDSDARAHAGVQYGIPDRDTETRVLTVWKVRRGSVRYPDKVKG